jgi:CheY-like chemotaxis protein
MGHAVPPGGANAAPTAEPAKVGTSLIVTTDAAIATLISQALESVAISSESCHDAGECSTRVSRNRYEVVFIDFSLGAVATRAIDTIRSATSTRTSVVIAITANAEQSNQAFSCGAHFIIQQPITRSAVDSILRAAYGLIIRERRRYFRCPVSVSINAHRRTEGEWVGRLANVSEGGLCILAPISLTPGESLELKFKLPQSNIDISAGGEVLWADGKGRVGLQFTRIDRESQSDLHHWLTDQLDAMLKPTLARLAPTAGGFLQSVMEGS